MRGTAYRSVLIVVLLAFFSVSAFAQPAKPAGTPSSKELIAVLDVEGVNATKAEVFAMSDRLREELLKTGKFTLVDRAQLNKVLEEQALQQTGCTSQECAVQVGRVLGVRKLVTGRAIKVGDGLWQVSGQMVNVESAEIVVADSIRHRGDMFSLLDDAIVGLAHRIGGSTVAGVVPVTAAAVASKPPPVLLPAAEPKKIALLPPLLTGQYAGDLVRGRSDVNHQLDSSISRAFRDLSIVPRWSWNEDVGKASWTGFFVKEPNVDSVSKLAQANNIDAALLYYSSSNGSAALSYQLYLVDASNKRMFTRSGSWTAGPGPRG